MPATISIKSLRTTLANAKSREAADAEAAEAKVAEAKARYEEWLKPQLEYHAACEEHAGTSRYNARCVTSAEAALRQLFAPHVEEVRRRLVHEHERTLAAFRGFGNSSNAVEIDARAKLIRDKITRLDMLHFDATVSDPAAGVRAVIENPPLPPLDVML